MGGGGISSGFKVWFHRYWSIYTGFVVITDVLCMYKKERKLKIGWHKKITAKNMIVITLTTGSLECLVETVNHTSNLPITLYKE